MGQSKAEVSRPETPKHPRDGGSRAAAVMAAAAAAGRMNAVQPPQSQNVPSGYERWPVEADGQLRSPFSYLAASSPEFVGNHGTERSGVAQPVDASMRRQAGEAAVMAASEHSTCTSSNGMRQRAAAPVVQDGNVAPQEPLWFPKTLPGYISQASNPFES